MTASSWRLSDRLFLLGQCRSSRIPSWLIDKFDVGHRRGVALARTEFHNSAVTARTACVPRRHFGEELANRIFLPEKRERDATRMKVALLAESDHLFGEWPYGFCLCQSGFDAVLCNQAANLICKQQIPVFGFTAQFNRLLPVAHNQFLDRNKFRFFGSFAAHRRFYQAGFKLHSQAQTELL